MSQSLLTIYHSLYTFSALPVQHGHPIVLLILSHFTLTRFEDLVGETCRWRRATKLDELSLLQMTHIHPPTTTESIQKNKTKGVKLSDDTHTSTYH